MPSPTPDAQAVTAAHDQRFVNAYIVAYHAHEPRADDPHAIDFEEWKRRQRAAGKWRCGWAARIDDDSQCSLDKPLEGHHAEIELALLNNVSFAALEHAFPGISDPTQVGAWIDSDPNLILYCEKHHRAAGAGVHVVDSAMYESSHFLLAGTLGPAPGYPAEP